MNFLISHGLKVDLCRSRRLVNGRRGAGVHRVFKMKIPLEVVRFAVEDDLARTEDTNREDLSRTRSKEIRDNI